jgi:glycosyltransferase involved in cell wall biosynthesis
MHLGRRERVFFPETYKEYRLIRTHGRVFGIPIALDPERVLSDPDGKMFFHPAVLSAATLEELRERIDSADEPAPRPEVVGRCEGHELVRLGDAVHAVPDGAGEVDLYLENERLAASVVSGGDAAEVTQLLRRRGDEVPVEFAGWLPIYRFAGNCGQHPQFKHTGAPPEGYRFTRSDPRPERSERPPSLLGQALQRIRQLPGAASKLMRPLFALFRPGPGVSLRARWRTFVAMLRLYRELRRNGCRLGAIARFLQTRHLQSQLLLGDHKGLVFLTSMPFTFGQNPWLIEIEDPTTLFFPLIHNGHNAHLDVRASPYLPVVKTLLEDDACKAILTHVRSTAELVPALFGSETIKRKVVHAPLGVPLPRRHQRHEPRPDSEPIDLLFINSWCQVPENFYVRGGLDVLEAFATLRERYPQLRLTMRTALPALDAHYHRLIERGWVRVINRFVTAEEMAELHAGSHVYLLPAARLHVVSLLQAMSYGLAVVASDGWGIPEYLDHERTGLIVPGRYGKTSWADREAGFLREDYEPTYTPDPVVVQGIVEAVSRLVEDPALRARLGRAARAEVEAKYTLEQWNRGMKTALDLAAGERRDASPPVERAGTGGPTPRRSPSPAARA